MGRWPTYGAHKETVRDLLLFWSSKEGKNTTLAAYKDRMPEDQPYYYYLPAARAPTRSPSCPQVERILDKGYEILYCTEDVDDFVMKALGEIDGKQFKSVNDEDRPAPRPTRRSRPPQGEGRGRQARCWRP